MTVIWFSRLSLPSLEESLLYSFLCENFHQQSCKAFAGVSKRAQIIGGGRHFLPIFFPPKRPTPAKTATCKRHSLAAPQL